MPLQRCQENGVAGWRWGQQGKCYVGPGAKRKAVLQGVAIGKATIPSWAHYREADKGAVSCGTCDFYSNHYCEMFSARVEPEMLCDEWEGRIAKQRPEAGLTNISEEDARTIRRAIDRLEPMHNAVVKKAQAKPREVNLRVIGVSKTPDDFRIYRMATREGHYIGRTNPTKLRALKHDVLKIQANDFRMSDGGDFRWENPNVVSHYSDRADSWKALEALAGGEIEKETAPGAAGDIPTAGDEGHAEMPSGPTLASVHIDAPLPNISVAYAGKTLRGKKIKVVKAEPYQQLVYGVVLEPNSMDSQDDYMLPAQVEKTAHRYLKKAIRGQSSVAKLQHRKQGFFKEKPSLIPVESFIAPVDFTYDGKEMIKAGSWVLAMHVEDPQLWEDFVNQKFTGFSIGGSGLRQSWSKPTDDVPRGYMTQPGSNDWAKVL